MTDTRSSPEAAARSGSPWEVFLIFLRLGITSFGGPVAHLGYFREAFVVRRKWLDEAAYANLMALCHFLPGPTSSQIGLALGHLRAGYLGAFAAWLGFTLPSAILMAGFAWGVIHWGMGLGGGWLMGLKLAALAVVAQAVWGMAQTLTPDRPRLLIAIAAAAIVLTFPFAFAQIAVLALAALFGALYWRNIETENAANAFGGSRTLGLVLLGMFFVLLAGLPLLAELTGNPALNAIDRFYRAGSLVFGGGHVVLPLLQTAFVDTRWVDENLFLAGYGAAQAVPGPLFSFAAYLGTFVDAGLGGLGGAALGLIAIYVPSALLVFGVLPFWSRLSASPAAAGALRATNAAVVGLLLAALYDPVFTSAVRTPFDMAFALVLLGALAVLKLPPWLVVIGAALAGYGLGFV